MKDLIIRGPILKRELSIFAICFGLGFLLNIIGIAVYQTSWVELFSMLYVVFIVAVVFYVLIGIIRLAVLGVQRLTARRA